MTSRKARDNEKHADLRMPILNALHKQVLRTIFDWKIGREFEPESEMYPINFTNSAVPLDLLDAEFAHEPQYHVSLKKLLLFKLIKPGRAELWPMRFRGVSGAMIEMRQADEDPKDRGIIVKLDENRVICEFFANHTNGYDLTVRGMEIADRVQLNSGLDHVAKRQRRSGVREPTPRQMRVILLRQLGKTFGQIGKELDITSEGARKIHIAGMKNFKKSLKAVSQASGESVGRVQRLGTDVPSNLRKEHQEKAEASN